MRQLKGADGYGVERLLRRLLVQFMEELSDRELSRYLEKNLAAKWLCGFTLSEPTPDYSLFNRVRTRIGPTRLSQSAVKLVPRDLNILCQGCLGLSALRVPVSRGVSTVLSRTVMNNAG